MKEIIFITGNKYKFEVAKKALSAADVKLTQKTLGIPEIQSKSVSEVASFSAIWARNQIHKPVLVTDAGYYIKSLNGFPGPFIKYINQWLTAEDILNLMKGKNNRSVEVQECIAYAEPGKKPVTFMGNFKGTISLRPGKKGMTSINEIFIPQGFNKPESEISKSLMLAFWGSSGTWNKFVTYLNKK
jgi:XTP/dITP diphosphohydrolase